MKFLVSNVGSTSLKFKLYLMPEEDLLCEARVENVGSATDAAYYYHNPSTGATVLKTGKAVANYTEGIRIFLNSLLDPDTGVVGDINDIDGVVFKTVLAKEYYGVHELTEPVLAAMEEYLFVAPVHNGAYLEAISVFKSLLPDTILIGAFETAFHTTIPTARRLYDIPYEWYERFGVMRMGYHGASHRSIAQTLETRYGKTGISISCHLGGSSSICAILDGRSIDNSFGFSLQTGVMHAARSGNADPYIFPFLLSKGMTLEEIHNGLSRKGGLLGISGVSSDLRRVTEAAASGHLRAQLAIDMLVESILAHIGSSYARLGGLDYLVFTGGIGENSPLVRKMVCERLSHMGVILDTALNDSPQDDGYITTPQSPVQALVLSTNEEIVLARQVMEFQTGTQDIC